MNVAQKRSCAIVVGMSLALILVIIAGVLHVLGFGWARLFLWAAAVPQGVGGVVCLRVRPDKGAVTSDERDKQIEKNAHLAGFGTVYLFVIVASFAPIAIFGEKGSLPVTWCPFLLIRAVLCQVYATSVAALVQYGRTGKGELP